MKPARLFSFSLWFTGTLRMKPLHSLFSSLLHLVLPAHTLNTLQPFVTYFPFFFLYHFFSFLFPVWTFFSISLLQLHCQKWSIFIRIVTRYSTIISQSFNTVSKWGEKPAPVSHKLCYFPRFCCSLWVLKRWILPQCNRIWTKFPPWIFC